MNLNPARETHESMEEYRERRTFNNKWLRYYMRGTIIFPSKADHGKQLVKTDEETMIRRALNKSQKKARKKAIRVKRLGLYGDNR
jgi:hypothetical protein